MDYTVIDKSDLKVSQLGFGCCPMGGHGWGKVDTDKIMEAVLVAIDNGVNFFDTADVYGLGESERILGASLKGQRNNAVIATKFGVRFDKYNKTYFDNSPEWIDCALNESLKRLNTDYIDLYQIHYRDNKTPLSEVIEAMERKKLEGKIRYYGFSNSFSNEITSHDVPEALISFQAEYSLANRSNEEKIIATKREKNLEFISWGSLAQGILSGKYNDSKSFSANDRRSRSTYMSFHGDNLRKNMLIVKEMKRISEYTGKLLPQIAIRWIIDYLGCSVVLTGVKHPDQIHQNIEAFGWHLKKNEIDSLDIISKQ